jgi:hypothetical protein
MRFINLFCLLISVVICNCSAGGPCDTAPAGVAEDGVAEECGGVGCTDDSQCSTPIAGNSCCDPVKGYCVPCGSGPNSNQVDAGK